MAVAEGLVQRNPALLLFTPKGAAKRERRVMTMKEVQLCFSVLNDSERLIAKFATLAGMRPGEIFALKWGQLTETYADNEERGRCAKAVCCGVSRRTFARDCGTKKPKDTSRCADRKDWCPSDAS
jgi:hypothetical protein